MNAISSLGRLRLQGLRILLLANWVWTVVLGLMAMAMGEEDSIKAMFLSALVNALPTVMVLRGRRDLEARMVMGTLAAVQPAIGVVLLSGHGWQMDGHMYFFVALAGLVLLYDWRPIVLGAALVALHHLLLNYLAPSWVFPGQGNLERIALHGVAVILQASVLCYLSVRLREMLLALDRHVAGSAELAEQAQAGRAAAEAAMAARREADAREAALRVERERERERMMADRRAETLALLAAFRQSIAEVADAVSAATGELEESALSLNDLARRASAGTGETVHAAEQSSARAAMLAQRIDQLSESITAIASAAHQQATLGGEAQRVSNAGHEAMRDMENHTASITSFAHSITQIASRTNLLALNATIEAARAGATARDTAQDATIMAGRMEQVADMARSTESLSGRVSSAASGLSRTAQDLQRATDLFVAQLEAA